MGLNRLLSLKSWRQLHLYTDPKYGQRNMSVAGYARKHQITNTKIMEGLNNFDLNDKGIIVRFS
jgi:hypothetical protein